MKREQHLPPSERVLTADDRFMVEALKEAWKAFDVGEVPVGAVVVHEGKVIARAHNQVELLQDATAHAEMLVIGAAAEALSGWRLEGCILYSTLEPCCMCAGALFLSRISRLIWGAPDIRHGANGSFLDVFSLSHPIHNVEVSQHVLKEWCALPMQQFFRKRRDTSLT
jgi:tRNA(adenine34) deaminase